MSRRDGGRRRLVKFGPVKVDEDMHRSVVIVVMGRRAGLLVSTAAGWVCRSLDGRPLLVSPRERWRTLNQAKASIRAGVAKWLAERL